VLRSVRLIMQTCGCWTMRNWRSTSWADNWNRELEDRGENLTLRWETSDPAPDPFEASVGDLTNYQVHFAESRALKPQALATALNQFVTKTLEFADPNAGTRCERLVFLWDAVYAMLTAVYTDESMAHDAPHVTKCHFTQLDEDGVDDEVTDYVRAVVASEVKRQRAGRLRPAMPVYFSDEDRASVGTEFKAQRIA
jgi:hypothetical protein